MLHGVSIGTGIVVPLAARHPVRGLVLECPLSSVADVAQDAWPFLPVRLLLRDRFDSVAVAPRVRCPVLVVCGGRDEIVADRHVRRLVEAFPAAPTVARLEQAGHNDLSAWPGYESAILDFVSRLPRP